MTEASILKQLTGVFRQIFDDDSIVLTPQTTPNDIGEWDWVNHVRLMAAVEVRFGIKFLTAETEDMKNAGDFVALILKKTAAREK